MKRISLVAALLGAIVLAIAGIAMAGGNGTQVSQYKTAYNDVYMFGPVSCSGVHQVKKDGSVTESWTCTSTSGNPLTYGQPGQTWQQGQNWLSDYDQVTHQPVVELANSWSFTESADGMSYTAVANYPNV
jgi:hypothetical protein